MNINFLNIEPSLLLIITNIIVLLMLHNNNLQIKDLIIFRNNNLKIIIVSYILLVYGLFVFISSDNIKCNENFTIDDIDIKNSIITYNDNNKLVRFMCTIPELDADNKLINNPYYLIFLHRNKYFEIDENDVDENKHKDDCNSLYSSSIPILIKKHELENQYKEYLNELQSNIKKCNIKKTLDNIIKNDNYTLNHELKDSKNYVQIIEHDNCKYIERYISDFIIKNPEKFKYIILGQSRSNSKSNTIKQSESLSYINLKNNNNKNLCGSNRNTNDIHTEHIYMEQTNIPENEKIVSNGLIGNPITNKSFIQDKNIYVKLYINDNDNKMYIGICEEKINNNKYKRLCLVENENQSLIFNILTII